MSVVKALNLNRVGWLEMLIALFPILGSYQYGPIPFSLFIPIILMGIIIGKYKIIKPLKFKEQRIFSLFVIIHEFILIFVASPIPFFHINNLLAFCITFVSILFVTPYINWAKFEGSINWVAIISAIGLVYQFIQVQSGQSVGILKIPFLPESGLVRMNELYPRPHSFFEEPAGYAEFMLVPLLFALVNKKYIWAAIISATILMSTSTTGLVLLFVELIVFALCGKTSISSKLVLVVLGGSMIWGLMNTELFSGATEKFTRESGDGVGSIENVRIVQGPYVVSTMEITDFVLGAPYVNTYQYCLKRHVPSWLYEVYGKGDDAMVYMTTFWQLILRFGLIGLFLYIMVYIRIFRCRELLPLLISYLIMCLTAAFWFGPHYFFYSIVMFSYIEKDKYNKKRIYSKNEKKVLC